MSERGWKQFERRCAVALGTTRIPVTGERAGADLENAMFAVQCKLGRRCPVYLQEWLAGIRVAGASRTPSKVGIVVWKPKGGRDRDALVVLAFADWCELQGSAGCRSRAWDLVHPPVGAARPPVLGPFGEELVR